MKKSYIKKLALLGAVSMVALYGAKELKAQTTSQIGATFTTAAALSSVAVSDIDFGTWAVNIAGGDTPTITQGAVTSGAPAVGTVAGVVDAATVVSNTVAPANSGVIDVTSPIATTLQIEGNVTTDFTDADISIGSIVFTDTVLTNTAVPAAFNGVTRVTVLNGGVAESIGFGGTLTLGGGGGTPAPGTVFNDAVIDISFTF